MQTAPFVFICYRRDDSGAWAGRIADQLISKFGGTNVFYDIESISPGSDFVRSLSERTAQSDVLLAIIGKGWLDARNSRGERRLDDPKDFVRLEIAGALQRGVRVIPVLVSGAEMPLFADLPPDIAPLAQREAIDLSLSNYRINMERLASILEREGVKRMLSRNRQMSPRVHAPQVNHEPVKISPFLQKVAAGAATVFPWMLNHRLVSVALMLLAVLTFAPLWLPSGINVDSPLPTPQAMVRPKVEAPETKPPHALQRVFLISGG